MKMKRTTDIPFKDWLENRPIHYQQYADGTSTIGVERPYLKILRLDQELPLPKYTTGGAAGIDLYTTESKTILQEHRVKIKTGIAMEIPEGHVGILKSRSGMAVRYWLDTEAGVLDSDYRGEIIVCLHNHLDAPYEVKRGDKITQLLIIPCPQVNIQEVSTLSESERGANGFGSTGRNVLNNEEWRSV